MGREVRGQKGKRGRRLEWEEREEARVGREVRG